MSSAYWQMNRQREQFDCGKGLKARVAAYSETWQMRCYSEGIPDEVPRKLQNANRAPSWKAVAIAILENDHNLYSLGFQLRETALSNDLWKAKKRETKKMDAMHLFEDKPKAEGAADPYEAVKVIEAWGLNYCLGRAVEYIAESRGTSIDSLEKAAEYLSREIETRKKIPRVMRKVRGSAT